MSSKRTFNRSQIRPVSISSDLWTANDAVDGIRHKVAERFWQAS